MMHSRKDDVFRNLMKTQPNIDAWRRPLDGVDHTALKRRIDLAPGRMTVEAPSDWRLQPTHQRSAA